MAHFWLKGCHCREKAANRGRHVRAPSQEPMKIGAVDVEEFSHNLARLVEEGGRALAAYLKPREEGRKTAEPGDEVVDVVKTLGRVAEYWLADPQRAVELQTRLGQAYLELWGSAAKRLTGEETAAVASPDARDKRFSDPEWSSNQFFDFLKQAYLLTATWADRMVTDAADLDPHTRQKAEFYIRQIVNAVSPSNFVLTNPELLRETLTTNADNLVRGMRMLAEDIEAGDGDLKIRQSDSSMFAVGRNLALSPGKVIFQNDLMQLIQYAPSTAKVLKRPLLIVPPWINKFYILDLTPEKSFIKWCVDQGITVFCISWVNPDAQLAQKGFDDYMREGPLAALDAIRAGDRRNQGQHRRLLRRRHAACRDARHHGGAQGHARGVRRHSSPPRSISPTPATSRFLSTKTRSPRSRSAWASAAISKAARWPTPSICCARTT